MKKTLLNPFERYTEFQLLIAGVIITLTGSYLAYHMKARFDGVLDMHSVGHVRLWQPFADNAINILALSATLFITGKLINKKTRLIDIINTILVARVALYLCTLIGLTDISDKVANKIDLKNPALINLTGTELLLMLLMGIATMVMFVLYICLLYNGFRVAAHARTIKHIIGFALAILVAEVISKILILNTVL